MAFTPNYLSQRDPRWSAQQLGFDGSITIGTDGCALTCLAMLVNGYGFSETPDSLNRKLVAMGAGVGFIGGLVVWGSLTRACPGIIYRDIAVWHDRPTDMPWINNALDAGNPVVVEVDNSPAPGLQNHWVVLYARQGNDYLMLDPWPNPPDNQATTLSSRYGFGRAPQDYVTAAVLYTAQGAQPSVPETPPPGQGLLLRVPASVTAGLRLRTAASTTASIITTEPTGAYLRSLETEANTRAKVGKQDQWLNVLDSGGNKGFVAAWFVELDSSSAVAEEPKWEPIPEPSGFAVVVPAKVTAGLRLRDQPSMTGSLLALEPAGTTLSVLEAAATAQVKIGVQDKWLNVRDPKGRDGYVAAWLVEQATGTPPPVPVPSLTVTVSSAASAGLRLRDQPNTNGNILKVLMPGVVLTVQEDAAAARAKIGQQNQWLKVKDASGTTGYVAAWYVTG